MSSWPKFSSAGVNQNRGAPPKALTPVYWASGHISALGLCPCGAPDPTQPVNSSHSSEPLSGKMTGPVPPEAAWTVPAAAAEAGVSVGRAAWAWGPPGTPTQAGASPDRQTCWRYIQLPGFKGAQNLSFDKDKKPAFSVTSRQSLKIPRESFFLLSSQQSSENRTAVRHVAGPHIHPRLLR